MKESGDKYSLRGRVYDRIRDDILNGVIRCCGEPDIIFKEDALRILRAVRFATILNFIDLYFLTYYLLITIMHLELLPDIFLHYLQ